MGKREGFLSVILLFLQELVIVVYREVQLSTWWLVHDKSHRGFFLHHFQEVLDILH